VTGPRLLPARRALAGVAAAAAAAVALLAPAAPAQAATHASTKVSTRTLLSQLEVAGEHPSGYRRTKFQLWVDADHDGCNTRAEVLLAEARTAPHRSASCALTGGRWVSSYDGTVFTRAGALDIDHVVPLAEAWQSGAYRWDAPTRTAYANDLGYARSLIAVSAHANRSKGEKEPQAWMPARGRCSYVTSWVAVKWRWTLGVNAAERAFVKRTLAACGWPTVTKPARAVVHTGSDAAPTSGTDPRFDTCTEAKAHGYGPYRSGVDTEYAWYTDRDEDGVVCE
jgi:hypothetical protein